MVSCKNKFILYLLKQTNEENNLFLDKSIPEKCDPGPFWGFCDSFSVLQLT